MKKLISVLVVSLLLIAGCTGVKTVSSSLENEALLTFVGTPSDYKNGVEVNVDDKINFIADVQKDKKASVKGKSYAISTGKHNLTVKYQGRILFQKQIFISAKETKKIELP